MLYSEQINDELHIIKLLMALAQCSYAGNHTAPRIHQNIAINNKHFIVVFFKFIFFLLTDRVKLIQTHKNHQIILYG